MPAYKDEKMNTWYVMFYYKDWQGKRIKKKKCGFKTKKEALAYENEFKDLGEVRMNVTLEEFVSIYFEDKKNELKERSIMSKKYMINTHIIPYFGKCPMDSIAPADIIKWQSAMTEKGYKPTYLRMLSNQLTALFNHAQNIYDLKYNPCKKVKKMGKADADKLSFWTKEEYDKFISSIPKESMYYIIFQILFWTGCREGELLALTGKDIDFEANTINIDKTYFRAEGKDIITAPKTEESVRVITIPEFLKQEIADYLGRLYDYPMEARLFPVSARAIQKKLRIQSVKEDLQLIRVHDLRHSHVALLINEGVQPLLIKERLGHKDIKITMNTYGHLYPSQQKAVAEMLNQRR